MVGWFESQPPELQAFIASLFTWCMTALGAMPVLFMKKTNRRLLNGMLGFAGGIMLAASCWSLLIPAIEMADIIGMNAVAVVSAGFMAGGLFMFACDVLLPENNIGGMDRCSSKLMFSITLHNIPEGLCVGVAFGAAALDIAGAELLSACMLALGIGLQNFPEGAAVSLPMVRSGMNRGRAFMYGQLSGMVEPAAAVFGALLVMHMRMLLPALLAFAAGTMVSVVAGEVFAESTRAGERHCSAIAAVSGFALMMAMDVMFG